MNTQQGPKLPLDELQKQVTEQEQRIYDLSAALYLLSHYYEGDTGGVHYMDRAREYLARFEMGRQVLHESDERTLRSAIFDGEEKQG